MYSGLISGYRPTILSMELALPKTARSWIPMGQNYILIAQVMIAMLPRMVRTYSLLPGITAEPKVILLECVSLQI